MNVPLVIEPCQARVRCSGLLFFLLWRSKPGWGEGESWRWIMTTLISSEHTWGCGALWVSMWVEMLASPDIHLGDIDCHLRCLCFGLHLQTLEPLNPYSFSLPSISPSVPRVELSATWSEPAGSSPNQWLVFFHSRLYFLLYS